MAMVLIVVDAFFLTLVLFSFSTAGAGRCYREIYG